jgi:hypothetical protein
LRDIRNKIRKEVVMTFNKTITTNVVEYGKTVVLTALIVGIAAFMFGVHYQKNSTVQVDNKVVLSNAVVVPEVAAEAKK